VREIYLYVLPSPRYLRLQLDQATREEIGRQAKRVLDWGRLRYMEEATDLEVQCIIYTPAKCSATSRQVKLKYYCDPFISLENALLVCSRPLGATG
jgi:hypothetical protein